MPERDETTGAPGFRAYADDSARELDGLPRTGEDAGFRWRPERPQPEFGLDDEDDFSIGEALPPLRTGAATTRAAGTARRRNGLFGILATAVAACAVGIGVGLGWDDLKDQVLAPGSAESSTHRELRTPRAAEPSPPEAPPPQVSAPKAATAAPPTAPPSPAPAESSAEPRAAPIAQAPPPTSVVTPTEESSAAVPSGIDASVLAASPSAPPSDCFDAGTLTGQLGCDDPVISQAHRQMARAYRDAQDAGAPPEQLSADQARWATLRARAAQTSHAALLGAYQQRIRELEASQ